MNSKQGHTHSEEELRAAIRAFVISISPRNLVVADMSTFIRATATLPLSNLAYWERLIRDELSLAQRALPDPKISLWHKLLPFTGPKRKAEPGRFLNWMDLCSFDGYVRERTLRTLAGPAPNGFLFALAARRLNDWVPQVRLAARQAVPLLARASDPEHVVDVLCAMLPMWTSWGRLEELDRQVVAELVSIEGIAELLKRRVISSPAGPMSAVLSQGMRTAILDEHLTEIAAKAIQPAVRAKAHRALLSGKARWVEARHWQWTDVRYCEGRMKSVLGERALTRTPALMESLNSAAADRSSIVRRVAAEVLIGEMGHLGNSVLPLARRFAADASPPVAERGVFVLQQLEAKTG